MRMRVVERTPCAAATQQERQRAAEALELSRWTSSSRPGRENANNCNGARTNSEIELGVPVKSGFRVARPDRELTRVVLLDVLRGSVGRPHNRGRLVLRVLLDFDDEGWPVLRPGCSDLAFREPALNDI